MMFWRTFLKLRVTRAQSLRNSMIHTVYCNCAFQTLQLPQNPPQIFVSEKKKENFNRKLLEFGFSSGQVKHILNSPHCILHLTEKDLSSNLLNWFAFELKSKLYTVLTSRPELLLLKPSQVQERITELMTLFTRADINKLFLTCPQVFLDDFATVKNKVEYIVNDMGVEQKSIVKAEALQFDLDYMKGRHNFLKRAGYYKVVKKMKSKNPPLNKVFSRNVKTFLKLTNLTEEEYLVFLDAYAVEEEFIEEICQLEESYYDSEESDEDD